MLRLAEESLTDARARALAENEVRRLVQEAPAHQAMLLWWSTARSSLAAFRETAPLRPEYELWKCLDCADAHRIVTACDQARVEPEVMLAAWVYDRPHCLAMAVEAMRFGDGSLSEIDKQVTMLVRAAADADALAASAVIDDIDWQRDESPRSEYLRGLFYVLLIEELSVVDREEAYRRACMIKDSILVGQALATLAAAIASVPDDRRPPSLADVLTTAHLRAGSTAEFANTLISGLKGVAQIEPRTLAMLLAETTTWPAGRATYLIGPLLSLLSPDHAADAADALLASHSPTDG